MIFFPAILTFYPLKSKLFQKSKVREKAYNQIPTSLFRLRLILPFGESRLVDQEKSHKLQLPQATRAKCCLHIDALSIENVTDNVSCIVFCFEYFFTSAYIRLYFIRILKIYL